MNSIKKILKHDFEFIGMFIIGFVIVWLFFGFLSACKALYLGILTLMFFLAIFGDNKKYNDYYCLIGYVSIIFFAMAYWW